MKIRLDKKELTEILENYIESKTGIKVASRPLFYQGKKDDVCLDGVEFFIAEKRETTE